MRAVPYSIVYDNNTLMCWIVRGRRWLNCYVDNDGISKIANRLLYSVYTETDTYWLKHILFCNLDNSHNETVNKSGSSCNLVKQQVAYAYT